MIIKKLNNLSLHYSHSKRFSLDSSLTKYLEFYLNIRIRIKQNFLQIKITL